jgi:hypothetical protein
MNPSPTQPTHSVFTSRRFVLLTLLLANLGTIWLFVWQNGSIMQVLWSYWLQSVIIGAVHVFRIASLPLDGITLNGKTISAQDSPAIKNTARVFLAGFFIVHYGMFHVGYMIFLIVFSTQDVPFMMNGAETTLSLNEHGVAPGIVLLSGAAFAVHHILSFIGERQAWLEHPKSAPHMMTVLFRPYSRILPMHLIIILGPVIAMALDTNAVFIAFMILKTLADLALFGRGTSRVIANSGANQAPLSR